MEAKQTNIITQLNHAHPAEHGDFKEANKGKVTQAKSIQSTKPTTSQQPQNQPQYEDQSAQKGK